MIVYRRRRVFETPIRVHGTDSDRDRCAACLSESGRLPLRGELLELRGRRVVETAVRSNGILPSQGRRVRRCRGWSTGSAGRSFSGSCQGPGRAVVAARTSREDFGWCLGAVAEARRLSHGIPALDAAGELGDHSNLVVVEGISRATDRGQRTRGFRKTSRTRGLHTLLNRLQMGKQIADGWVARWTSQTRPPPARAPRCGPRRRRARSA